VGGKGRPARKADNLTAICAARKQSGEHVSAALNQHAKLDELLEAMFSMRPVPRLCNGEERETLGGGYPCGGGIEYLHRSPASRRRR
jgi:hypothetical protein